MESCYHCGDQCGGYSIKYRDKVFCCNGCKAVFEILSDHNLSYYYDLEKSPGISPSFEKSKYDFLDNNDIINDLVDFDEDGIQVITFNIPSIHCSSCIWVLENLNKIHTQITSSQVDFPKKSVRIRYSIKKFSLKELVLLLSHIGYEPNISLQDTVKSNRDSDRSLIYKLGVAGFAFGNIMFLSFPEYFEVGEFWLEKFKNAFRWLMISFAIPVVFYSASDYFISAFKGLRSKILNIDVPIALGITVLFLRSLFEIILDIGTGFLDSLAGLVFFLLVGKFFQQKTYSYLSFDRDYKSYFPVGVTLLEKGPQDNKKIEVQVPVHNLKTGDHVLIRYNELLPVDVKLSNGNALMDYSFVTGEAEPVKKQIGDTLFAGGRQMGTPIEVEVLRSVKQSYLTQLWSNEIFEKGHESRFQSLTDSISKYFTLSLLSVAIISASFWSIIDISIALNVFTAVLIVACPCAIALAAPFTHGNLLRLFGRNKFYIKNASIIEELSNVNTFVFDKTGTLTTNKNTTVHYKGVELTDDEKVFLTTTLRASNHPLSRALYKILKDNGISTLDEFDETIGRGILGKVNGHIIKVGSLDYVDSGVKNPALETSINTEVNVSIDNQYKGTYVFYNTYREGIKNVFNELGSLGQIIVLSGDNDGEKEALSKLLPKGSELYFNQKPDDKLVFIKRLQEKGKKVLMVGDGLNDAGALAQSDVGITISEDINTFSPACDAILEASRFKDIPLFMKMSKKAMKIIKYAFIFSLLYNLIGLGFAITGHLVPVVAAILMPLSSISIVIFTTLMVHVIGKKFLPQ